MSTGPIPSDEVIAEVSVSAPRRLFAMGTLVGLGLILLWLAAIAGGGALWPRGGFLVAGLLSLGFGWRMWQATSVGLVLTEAALFDSTGRLLAEVDHIKRVERGVFAFKPSNGFLLHLDQRMGRVWQPGLWWRLGAKLGVGGVCNGAQTRAMADIIAIKLARAGR